MCRGGCRGASWKPGGCEDEQVCVREEGTEGLAKTKEGDWLCLPLKETSLPFHSVQRRLFCAPVMSQKPLYLITQKFGLRLKMTPIRDQQRSSSLIQIRIVRVISATLWTSGLKMLTILVSGSPSPLKALQRVALEVVSTLLLHIKSKTALHTCLHPRRSEIVPSNPRPGLTLTLDCNWTPRVNPRRRGALRQLAQGPPGLLLAWSGRSQQLPLPCSQQ